MYRFDSSGSRPRRYAASDGEAILLHINDINRRHRWIDRYDRKKEYEFYPLQIIPSYRVL